MSFTLPLIYPITDERLSGLSHAEQVRELASAGCTFVQVRGKGAPPERFFADVEKAVEESGASRCRIVVNDRVDIALTAGAHGVHLGQDDLPPEAARRLLGPAAVIGFSTHSVGQALKAITLPVDYIAIGPIFETATKSDTDPVVGLEGLIKVRDAIGTFPLVAIGGINRRNVYDVISAGADSAAIISDLFSPGGDIAENYSTLAKIANNAKQI